MLARYREAALGEFMSDQDKENLWKLRKTWIGISAVVFSGRWHARRIDGFPVPGDDWISAATAAELGSKIQADYAARAFQQ